MIKLDISNVWGALSLPDMLATEQEVFDAHKLLTDGKGLGSDYLGWLNLPTFEETDELRRIRRAAERIRSDSEVFVVVGIGGSYLGPRAAIELVKGANHRELAFLAASGLATGASWLCYYYAIQMGQVSVVVQVDKLSLLVSIAFAAVVFGERLSRRGGIGLALIVAGTALGAACG